MICQAPYRLPEGYWDKYEAMTPEEGAVTAIVEVLSQDHACGDPVVDKVKYRGRVIPVCVYHLDFFKKFLQEN